MGYFTDTYGSSATPQPPVAQTQPTVQPGVQPVPQQSGQGGFLGFINRTGNAVRNKLAPVFGKPAVEKRMTQAVGLAGDLTSTFARTGLTIGKSAQSVAGLVAYGMAVAKGDRDLAQRILNQNPAAANKLGQLINEKDLQKNLPVFGQTKAYKPPKDIKTMSQYAGAGAEIGMWLAPMASAALNASSKALMAAKETPNVVRIGRFANALNRAKKGFMTGVKVAGPSFAVWQGGHEAQKDESTAKTIALQTAGGYVTGVGFSTLGGFIAGMVAKQPKGVQEGISAFERSMKTQAGGNATKEELAQIKAGLAYTPTNHRLSDAMVKSVIEDSQKQLDGASMNALLPSETAQKALKRGLESLKAGEYQNMAELAAAIDRVASAAPMEVRNLLVRQGFASMPAMLQDPSMASQAASLMFTPKKGSLRTIQVKPVDIQGAVENAAYVAPETPGAAKTVTVFRSNRSSGGNALGGGLYGSTDRKIAQTYADQQGGKIVSVQVSAPSKILKISSQNRYQEIVTEGERLALKHGQKGTITAGEAVKLYAQKNGYQAVDATGLGDATGMVFYNQPKVAAAKPLATKVKFSVGNNEVLINGKKIQASKHIERNLSGEMRNLVDIENADLTDRELARKIIILREEGGVEDTLKQAVKDLSARQTPAQLPKGVPASTKMPKSQPVAAVPSGQSSEQVGGKLGGSSATPLSQTEKAVNTTKEMLGGGKLKERGFITHVKVSENTPERLKKIVSGEYIPRNNADLRKAARELIKVDQQAAEGIAMNPQNDVHVQIGNELLAHYAATGQTQKAKLLAKGMAESGTEFGRAVQAYANYDITTPEGALKFAQSKVQAYNRANPKKLLDLSDRQIQSLFTRAENVQKMAEGRARNIATAELIEDVNNLIPSTFDDKAITVWKAGLLTSLRTHERNILGNFLHSIGESVKDAPAVINDMLLAKRTGQRTITMTLRAGPYTRKGVQAAKDMFYKGFDPEQTIEKMDIRHVTWDNTPMQQFLKKTTNVVFRALGAEDKVFYNRAFGRSLYDQAGAAAINAGQKGSKTFIEGLVAQPTKEMTEVATKEAQRAIFQNKNILRDVASAIKHTATRNEYAKFITEFVAPFTGVPSSIAGEIAAYSPLGLMRGVIGSAKVLLNPAANKDIQRTVSQQVGRGVIGSGILGAGAYLAKRGLMTGEPRDEAERRQWELEGKQANSIMINGKWRNINSVGPELIILLAGGEWGRQNKTKENPFTAKVLNTAAYLAKAFTNQTFLAGIQQPLAVITDPAKNKPVRLISSQIASWIPNIIKDVARSVDTKEREVNGVLDQTVNSIPWARSTLMPKRDVLGKELPNEQRGLSAFVDLFRSKSPVNHPLVNELSRLYNMGTPATPSKIDATQKWHGISVKLNPKLLDTLEAQSGGMITTLLTALINTDKYRQANDQKKKKYIDTVVETVRNMVKQRNLLPIIKKNISEDEQMQKLLSQ